MAKILYCGWCGRDIKEHTDVSWREHQQLVTETLTRSRTYNPRPSR